MGMNSIPYLEGSTSLYTFNCQLYMLNKIIESTKGKVNGMHALLSVRTLELGKILVFVVGPNETNLAITRGRRKRGIGRYWRRGGCDRV